MSAGPDQRARALEQIVVLAREHRLTASEIGAALAHEPAPAHESHARTVIVRVLGYLGGTFVFAGIAAFIALQWDAMNAAARVVITLGPGIAAFVLATLATRDPRFDKAVPPLFLIAAALEPTGLLVAFNEFGSGGDARWAALVTAGAGLGVTLDQADVFDLHPKYMLPAVLAAVGSILLACGLTGPPRGRA